MKPLHVAVVRIERHLAEALAESKGSGAGWMSRGSRSRRAASCTCSFQSVARRRIAVVLPKAPIADAIEYARNQWGALTRFLEDARLKLDNNAAESQLRRVALGRRNWLFAGSEEGAGGGCVLYSLIASCRLHDVNPFEYLRDVLVRVGDHPAHDVFALSPKNWKQTHESTLRETPRSRAERVTRRSLRDRQGARQGAVGRTHTGVVK